MLQQQEALSLKRAVGYIICKLNMQETRQLCATGDDDNCVDIYDDDGADGEIR